MCFCDISARAQIIINPYIYVSAGSFTAQTAVFDGTNDSMSSASAPTGIADSKTFTFSDWVRFDGANATEQALFSIYEGGSLRFEIYKWTDNKIYVYGKNQGNTVILDFNGGTAITAGSTWYHIYICADTATAANNKIYINGVAETVTITTRTDDTLDLAASGPYLVGARTSGQARLFAAQAELWFEDSWLDAPNSFRSGGRPVSLGATGNTPTGSAPVYYFSLNGSGDSWAVSSAGNGNMTVTGTLTTTTPP